MLDIGHTASANKRQRGQEVTAPLSDEDRYGNSREARAMKARMHDQANYSSCPSRVNVGFYAAIGEPGSTLPPAAVA